MDKLIHKRNSVRKQATADKVLIIEGTPALGKGLARSLTRAGFKVARIANCPETLLTLHALKPDIVIIDEIVGESVEVCHQIRSALGTPVILVGKDSSEDIWTKALLEAGADFYLRKPFSDKVLLARLRAILGRYRKTVGSSIRPTDK